MIAHHLGSGEGADRRAGDARRSPSADCRTCARGRPSAAPPYITGPIPKYDRLGPPSTRLGADRRGRGERRDRVAGRKRSKLVVALESAKQLPVVGIGHRIDERPRATEEVLENGSGGGTDRQRFRAVQPELARGDHACVSATDGIHRDADDEWTPGSAIVANDRRALLKEPALFCRDGCCSASRRALVERAHREGATTKPPASTPSRQVNNGGGEDVGSVCADCAGRAERQQSAPEQPRDSESGLMVERDFT